MYLLYIICIIILASIANFKLLEARKNYVHALCDLNDKIAAVVEAGLEKTKHLDNAAVQPTIEDMTNIVTIATLTGIMQEINKECQLTKLLPFRCIGDPNKKVYKKFKKYLPMLNESHKKFLV